jgi:hypothetical protein
MISVILQVLLWPPCFNPDFLAGFQVLQHRLDLCCSINLRSGPERNQTCEQDLPRGFSHHERNSLVSPRAKSQQASNLLGKCEAWIRRLRLGYEADIYDTHVE